MYSLSLQTHLKRNKKKMVQLMERRKHQQLKTEKK